MRHVLHGVDAAPAPSSTSCIRSLSDETITTRSPRACAAPHQRGDQIVGLEVDAPRARGTPNASTTWRTSPNCGFRSSGGSVRLALYSANSSLRNELRARVEHHRQVRRPMVDLQLDQHLREAVDRARRHARLGRQRRQRVIGAKDEARAVDEVERVGVRHAGASQH